MGPTPPSGDNACVTTVLIVDDHSGFRMRARRLLEADGFTVVGEAADGAAGIEEARRLEPDLVLLDLHLPDTSGFAVSTALTGESPAPVVIITSTRDSEDFGALAQRSGARGFVSKDELSGAALTALLARR
jgi:DNA-binding NarL/FixJ family response regulator